MCHIIHQCHVVQFAKLAVWDSIGRVLHLAGGLIHYQPLSAMDVVKLVSQDSIGDVCLHLALELIHCQPLSALDAKKLVSLGTIGRVRLQRVHGTIR
jgi:hypothetical protein